MLKLFDNKYHPTGKDYQLASSVDNIATTIWEIPALEQEYKNTFVLTPKCIPFF